MAERREGLIVAIGVFKLLKSAVLSMVGVGTLLSMPDQIAAVSRRISAHMGLLLGGGRGHHTLQDALGKLSSMNRTTEQRIGMLALAYAAIFLVEGVGLLLRKRWAEWLTVVVTTSFIPLEIYELAKRFGMGKVLTLVVNIAIVAYLLWRRLSESRSAGGRLRRTIHAV
jgi:uncharacterized membrane protein (DUF2068 family)